MQKLSKRNPYLLHGNNLQVQYTNILCEEPGVALSLFCPSRKMLAVKLDKETTRLFCVGFFPM